MRPMEAGDKRIAEGQASVMVPRATSAGQWFCPELEDESGASVITHSVRVKSTFSGTSSETLARRLQCRDENGRLACWNTSYGGLLGAYLWSPHDNRGKDFS